MKIIAQLRLLLAAIPALMLAQAEKNGLRLEVFTEVLDCTAVTDQSQQRYVLTIQPLLKNVSDQPITIATSTYTGNPTGSGGPKDEPFVGYSIGPLIIGNRPVQPSPVKFCAVTLAPGECGALPPHEVPMTSPDQAKRVKITYSVFPAIASSQGWWSGELVLTQEITPPKLRTNIKR